jgi:hypothetical protein
MASLVILESDDFLKSFIKKYDYNNYNFILVSSDIDTKNKYKNVFRAKQLLPPSKALAHMANGNEYEEYYKKYVKYLSRPEVEIFLTTIAKLVAVEGSNVILLCSKSEAEMKYLNIIKEYFEEIYQLKVFSYKKYKKDPDNCDSVTKKKKTIKIIDKKTKAAAEMTVSVKFDPEDVKARLKHQDEDTLRAMAKRIGVKVKKSDDKKTIIKKIKKASNLED